MARCRARDVNMEVETVVENFTCAECAMDYIKYEQLVTHLYWKHGTQSKNCNKCSLKMWSFALHQCGVIPTVEVMMCGETNNDSDDSQYFSEEPEFCICGKPSDGPMIGCDGPNCTAQWYHFSCIGILTAPEGEWWCPKCTKHYKKRSKLVKGGQ